jgi:hypothetical protein
MLIRTAQLTAWEYELQWPSYHPSYAHLSIPAAYLDLIQGTQQYQTALMCPYTNIKLALSIVCSYITFRPTRRLPPSGD